MNRVAWTPHEFRAWRDGHGISQKGAALVLMCSTALVSMYESGDVVISPHVQHMCVTADCIAMLEERGLWHDMPPQIAACWNDVRERLHAARLMPLKRGRMRKEVA